MLELAQSNERLALLLAACGGGGPAGSTDEPNQPEAPAAPDSVWRARSAPESR